MKLTFPDWNSFTPEFVAAELPRLLAASETAVAAIEAAEPKTYADYMLKLDDATRDLWHCWGGVSHMLSVMNSEAWRKIEEDFQPQVVAFSLRVGQSKKLYAQAKGLLERDGGLESACRRDGDGTGLSETQRRILEKTVEGAELAGVGLEGEKLVRFNEIQMKLAKLATDFSNAVIDATKAFSFEKDGTTYTIDDANYPETMKHCADREVREKLCRARSARAPENEVRIAEILKLRQEEAEILGFKTFAEKSVSTKCAPSVTAVMKMIDDLDVATKDVADEEERELVESWANMESACRRDGDGTMLAVWDRTYAAERLREKKYAYSEEELKKFFELEDVLKGLFKIANLLFDIDVEEVTGADKPSVWHPDVRFFAVKEKGEVISNFYFDPYVRNGLKSGGAWMNEFRNRRKVEKVGGGGEPSGASICLPLALVVMNIPLPNENGKTFLPFREVETLFHEFGHALQQMLTRIDEEDAAGINLVEWDAVEVASQFMENWCLDDRTGIHVPEELKAKVRAAKNFRAASACRRQLSFAKTDMLLHNGETRPSNDVKTEVFNHFGLPMVEEDRFLCAFTHIFSGGYSAGYYGYKWAEVMSADCYGAFEEAGLADDAAMKRLGAKYRETVLGLGGSISAIDVFRKFRGRDPEITALLRQQGLLKG